MKKFNDPVEEVARGFVAGLKGDGEPRETQPWAKAVLWFCFAVVLVVGAPFVYDLLVR